MNKRNYSRELDELIKNNYRDGVRPSLMLHVCCAVCASYVLEYLYPHFAITVAYYNPNITDRSEYDYRLSELNRYIDETGMTDIRFVEVDYDPERFDKLSEGLEDVPEGGARCARCFELRLCYTAELCKRYGCDYFATTLTISPLKNAEVINAVGEKAGRDIKARYLATDFKKKDGYKRSIELSRRYDLYRQNYCGCRFSYREMLNRNR